ncbi:3phosphoinositidedependent protein kinase 1like [Caligus rogercresseyi]|uniref:3-phosphoinositide-dependent protein kinase 1 n=1 Tax=Caligus rogercresseyi TaxID=217165 RepID=A0A7T8K1J8_CALRO|nr:3phosphoinositidedependent protein kinase 1like [Caligus rogercresseyi]
MTPNSSDFSTLFLSNTNLRIVVSEKHSQPASRSRGSGMSRRSSARKLSPNDFLFGRMIGEGSFSTVFLAKEISSGREMAVKVLEKDFIRREKKTEYVFSEKNILKSISDSWEPSVPFFVKLHSTFMDAERLYFVMSYAPNGDLLGFMERSARENLDLTDFYTAQILSAIEFLHFKLRVVHRDLKPENILLNEEMRILITDFGSAKFMDEPPSESSSILDASTASSSSSSKKRVSFVGSPEQVRGPSADLWALGCILYQMSQSEYIILKKNRKLEYDFHEGFNEDVKDLPEDRLGARDPGPVYDSIRNHAFLRGVDFTSLIHSTPEDSAAHSTKSVQGWGRPCVGAESRLEAGADRLAQLMIEEDPGDELLGPSEPIGCFSPPPTNLVNESLFLQEPHRSARLTEQIRDNKYHRFVEGNLILKQGLLDKKKGLWARRRMFLLTEGPHLYYVDPDNMILKGEIPGARTYSRKAKDWCEVIHLVKDYYYPQQ